MTAKMIKEGNRAVDSLANDSQEGRTGLGTVSGQMASLIRSVKELSGRAIAAANREMCQRVRPALAKIDARLATPEIKPGPPPAVSPPGSREDERNEPSPPAEGPPAEGPVTTPSNAEAEGAATRSSTSSAAAAPATTTVPPTAKKMEKKMVTNAAAGTEG